jgi:hypothetical protein
MLLWSNSTNSVFTFLFMSDRDTETDNGYVCRYDTKYFLDIRSEKCGGCETEIDNFELVTIHKSERI